MYFCWSCLHFFLIGTEKTADALVDLMDRDPSFFLSAVRCLRMPLQHREKIGQVLQANRCEVSLKEQKENFLGALAVMERFNLRSLKSICRAQDLLFAILVADNQLVSVLRRKRQSLLPQGSL